MTAISGEYVGMRSAELPSGYTTWSVWRELHPESGWLDPASLPARSAGAEDGAAARPANSKKDSSLPTDSSPVNDRMDSSAPKALTLPADSQAGCGQPGRTGSTRGRAEGILRSRGSLEQGRKVYVRVSRFT